MTTTTDTPDIDRNWISIRWHIDDVKEVRPDLTDEQARQVLHLCRDQHDANIGISRDVLSIWAALLFPEPDEAGESKDGDA